MFSGSCAYARVNLNSRGYVVWDFGLTTKDSETHFKVAPLNGGSRSQRSACLFLRYFLGHSFFARIFSNASVGGGPSLVSARGVRHATDTSVSSEGRIA